MTYSLETRIKEYLDEKGIDHTFQNEYGRLYYSLHLKFMITLPSIFTRMWTEVIREEILHSAQGYEVNFETTYLGNRKLRVTIFVA